MAVWLCIPSARPPADVEPVLDAWRERGYKIAIQRDEHEQPSPGLSRIDTSWVGPKWEDSLVHWRPYAGYGEAVNFLARDVLSYDPSCDWIVTGGDDTLPDPNHTAEEIAKECSMHFGELHAGVANCTFGVMQPTGDRFADGSIDRIAGSPWIGREFCLRVNQGNGPLWAEYWHMFDDEELQNVAIKLGVFWQRPDLIHLHRHFMRESDAIDSPAVRKDIPPHLIRANSKEHWDKNQKLFRERKAAGFPGHEPI